jgi:hypothetical protein
MPVIMNWAKYFDSDFFKYTFGFLAIISVGLVLIVVVSLYVGEGVDSQVAKPDVEMQN